MGLIQIFSGSKKINTVLMSSFLDSQLLRAVVLPYECLEIAEHFVATNFN